MTRGAITGILISIVLATAPAFADDPFLLKDTKKEYKQALKQFKAEGWSVWDGSISLEEAVKQYYLAIERAGLSPLLLRVSGIGGTSNAAMRRATNNATTEYSRIQNGQIDGCTLIRIKNEQTGDKAVTSTSVTSSRRSQSSGKVSLPPPILTLSRTLENNRFEVIIYYIIQ